jgi:DNA/RNA-binding protein KIN17
MGIVGEDPRKYIEQFSREFHHDFIQLLRVAHGEKYINANRFYQSYIANKEHVHMNATKWPSLTEYVKYLGREGICHVKEDEKDGLMIAWRDLSPEAVRRREAVREAEMLESRNEAGEDRMMKKMAARAKEEAERKAKLAEVRAAAAAATTEAKPDTSPAAIENGSEPIKTTEDGGEPAKTEEDTPKPEAAPVKVSFGLKAKIALPGKAQAPPRQNALKRMRDEERKAAKAEKAAKKLKA